MNGLPLILRTYPCPLWPNSWPDPEDSDFRIFVPGAEGSRKSLLPQNKRCWKSYGSGRLISAFKDTVCNFFHLFSFLSKIMTIIGRWHKAAIFSTCFLGCKSFLGTSGSSSQAHLPYHSLSATLIGLFWRGTWKQLMDGCRKVLSDFDM